MDDQTLQNKFTEMRRNADIVSQQGNVIGSKQSFWSESTFPALPLVYHTSKPPDITFSESDSEHLSETHTTIDP